MICANLFHEVMLIDAATRDKMLSTLPGATLVVYAAKHGQTALDGEGNNSPFVIALVQRVAAPNVEINKLFRLVRDDVLEATAGRQERIPRLIARS